MIFYFHIIFEFSLYNYISLSHILVLKKYLNQHNQKIIIFVCFDTCENKINIKTTGNFIFIITDVQLN